MHWVGKCSAGDTVHSHPFSFSVFSRFITVTCGAVDCTFVRTDAWLDFSRDHVSLWPKTRQGYSFSKNRCPRPRSMWQPRSLKHSFDNNSGAHPGTTYTRNTSVDSCNSNREKRQSPGFQCLVVSKTEGH